MPRPWDPQRLPRRNHYQEGPDFLFVATRGRSSAEGRTTRRDRQRGPSPPPCIASTGGRRTGERRSAPRSAAAGPACTAGGSATEAGGLAGLTDAPRRGRASECTAGHRASRDHGAAADLLEQPTPSRRVRPPRIWPLHHGQVDRLLDAAGTHRPSMPGVSRATLRAQRAQRAVAHRPQGAVLLRRPHAGRAQLPLRRRWSTTTAATCSASGRCRARRRRRSSTSSARRSSCAACRSS